MTEEFHETLGPSRLHEAHQSMLPFVPLIAFICPKLSLLFAHVNGVGELPAGLQHLGLIVIIDVNTNTNDLPYVLLGNVV